MPLLFVTGHALDSVWARNIYNRLKLHHYPKTRRHEEDKKQRVATDEDR
jgi:hypothetical protein